MPRSQRWKQRRLTSSADAPSAAVGGGYASLHGAYESIGATKFYEAHGSEYANPHDEILSKALASALVTWDASDALGTRTSSWRALDLACGGGEASMALEAWWKASGRGGGGGSSSSSSTARTSSGRGGNSSSGDSASAAVDGLSILACDPYTAARYEERTGRAAKPWSFSQVADGVLDDLPPFDLTLASFCLHLLELPELRATLSALARSSRRLLVATPHKRPAIDEATTGWRLAAEEVRAADQFEGSGSTRHRVRVRLYASATCKS